MILYCGPGSPDHRFDSIYYELILIFETVNVITGRKSGEGTVLIFYTETKIGRMDPVYLHVWGIYGREMINCFTTDHEKTEDYLLGR